MALQHFRSNTASKRPTAGAMSDGQIAVNTNATTPGLFFKNAGGAIVKVGPVHVGTTAPNSSPAAGGSTGNSLGEQWLDTSGGGYVLKIWDGSAWRSEVGKFVDAAGDTMTGALILPSGTAAAPALGVGSTDNGIYSPGADQVAISTNGTGRLFVDASGNISIGLSSSTTALNVTKTSSGADSNTALIQNRADAAGTTASIYFSTNTAGTGVERSAAIKGISTTGTATDLALFTNVNGGPPAERLRITSDGKVGVGTSDPGAYSASANKLVIADSGDAGLTIRSGTANTGSIYFADGTTGTSLFQGIIYYNHTNDSLNFHTNYAASSNPRMVIDSSGRVGVGTTSPSSVLHLKAASSPKLILDNSDSATDAIIDTWWTGTPLAFQIGSSEKARIDSSGRLLVGTSSDSSGGLFQIRTSSTSNRNISLRSDQASLGYPFIQYFDRSSNNAAVANNESLGTIIFRGHDGTNLISSARITAEVDGTPGANDMPGRLVFSTTADGDSSPTMALLIRQDGLLEADPTYANTTASAANMHISSLGFFFRSTSSQKYKTDIETLENSYADAILDIRPVWYRSTCKHDCPEHSWWGFIAEEVAAIDPRLVQWKTIEVSYDENGKTIKTPCDPEPDGVAYERFVPHLLNLIKRQKEQIESLEARLTAAGI